MKKSVQGSYSTMNEFHFLYARNADDRLQIKHSGKERWELRGHKHGICHCEYVDRGDAQLLYQYFSLLVVSVATFGSGDGGRLVYIYISVAK